MGTLTSRDLSIAVAAGMDFETLLTHLRPLIGKYSRRHVRGFEPEDLQQEATLVIWKCQRTYDVSKGSFLNLIIRSIENRMIQLRVQSTRCFEPVLVLQCRGCGTQIPRRGRGPVCTCGSAQWQALRISHGVVSLDDLDYEDPMGARIDPIFLGAIDEQYEAVDTVSYVQAVLADLEPMLLESAERALEGHSLTPREKKALAAVFMP